jgi:DNA polymerase-1
MARIVDTSELQHSHFKGMDPETSKWIYCGLDACVTAEVDEATDQLLTPLTSWIYKFQMAVRVPALSMMLRGIRVDQIELSKLKAELDKDRNRLYKYLQFLADAAWDKGINPNSSDQLQLFFYSCMGLPKIYHKNQAGEKIPTCNREALEKLSSYYWARPVCALILAIKDIDGLLKVLNSKVDPDGRFRTSFNVGATETGRWSSSKSVWGSGLNQQNVTPRVRRIFVSDLGCVLVNVDLAQAESRVVAYRSKDEGYIQACESADLHTTVAKMVWPELAWGQNSKDDRVVSDQIFYRNFSYRDMAKRGGHGTNYGGSAFQMAKHLKITEGVMEKFQTLYFKAFPGIPRWHEDVARQIQTHGCIVTAFGRARMFYGRLNDKETIKEAIAHEPQSTVADIVNYGLLRIWHNLTKREYPVYPLANGYDSLLLLVANTPDLPRICESILHMIETPLLVEGRKMLIPAELKIGMTWGEMYKVGDPRLAGQIKFYEERLKATPLQAFLQSMAG